MDAFGCRVGPEFALPRLTPPGDGLRGKGCPTEPPHPSIFGCRSERAGRSRDPARCRSGVRSCGRAVVRSPSDGAPRDAPRVTGHALDKRCGCSFTRHRRTGCRNRGVVECRSSTADRRRSTHGWRPSVTDTSWALWKPPPAPSHAPRPLPSRHVVTRQRPMTHLDVAGVRVQTLTALRRQPRRTSAHRAERPRAHAAFAWRLGRCPVLASSLRRAVDGCHMARHQKGRGHFSFQSDARARLIFVTAKSLETSALRKHFDHRPSDRRTTHSRKQTSPDARPFAHRAPHFSTRPAGRARRAQRAPQVRVVRLVQPHGRVPTHDSIRGRHTDLTTPPSPRPTRPTPRPPDRHPPVSPPTPPTPPAPRPPAIRQTSPQRPDPTPTRWVRAAATPTPSAGSGPPAIVPPAHRPTQKSPVTREDTPGQAAYAAPTSRWRRSSASMNASRSPSSTASTFPVS